VIITSLLAGLILRTKTKLASKWLFFLAAGTTLFFTYSRSAWLGIVLSAGILVYATIRNHNLRRNILLTGALALIIFGGLTAAFRHSNTLENTVFHTDETSKSLKSSNQARADALTTGFKSVIHEPFGGGPGTAGPASARNDHPARIAENYYIQIGQEVGLVGLVIFLAINVLVVRGLWRQKNDLFAAILLASFIGLTLINMLSHAWADDTLALLWWGLAGICLPPVILKQYGKPEKQ